MLLLLLLGACQKLNRFIHVMSCSKNSHLSLFIYFFPTFTQKLYNLLNPGPELSMLEIKILLTKADFFIMVAPAVLPCIVTTASMLILLLMDGCWQKTPETVSLRLVTQRGPIPPTSAHTRAANEPWQSFQFPNCQRQGCKGRADWLAECLKAVPPLWSLCLRHNFMSTYHGLTHV